MPNKKQINTAIKEIVNNRDDELDYAKTCLYCYLRVSTQSQVDEGHSIDNQRATGKKVAKQLGMKYIEMNEGACSSKADVYRPVYEDIKSRISNGEIKHLWVMNRNRQH